MADIATNILSVPIGQDLRRMIEQSTVFDIETTIAKEHNAVMRAHPKLDNRVVAIGYCAGRPGSTPVTLYEGEGLVTVKELFCTILNGRRTAIGRTSTEPVLLVGQNLKFDLSYAFDMLNFKDLPMHRMFLWDTYIADYYLTEQMSKPRNLEALAKERDIVGVKHQEISDAFRLGIGSDKVNAETLRRYLALDVVMTNEVYQHQLQAALAKGGPAYVRYLIGLMSAEIATTVMANRGFDVHASTLDAIETSAEAQMAKEAASVELLMTRYLPTNMENAVSCASTTQVKALLHGGPINTKHKETMEGPDGEPVLYKTGARKDEPRTKVVRTTVNIPPICVGIAERIKPHEVKGTDTDTLDNIIKYFKHDDELEGLDEYEDLIALCVCLKRVRDAYKTMRTYVAGIKKYSINGSLYPNFNHAVTATKRLSSSAPNFQNFSNKETESA